MTAPYVENRGTVSVVAGQSVATGTLTAWTQYVREGDLLLIGGVAVSIGADPTAGTSLTLGQPWPGPTVNNSPYSIVLFSPRHTWEPDVWARIQKAIEVARFITTGPSVPSAASGIENDIHIRTVGGAVAEIYTRGASAWSAPISLIGAATGSRQPNMVINGDFAVNQREFTGGALASGAYGFDRWRANGASTVSLSGGVLTLTGAIEQVIEPAMWGLQSFAGVAVTVSVDSPSANLSVFLGTAGGVISPGAGRRSITFTPTQAGNLALWLSPASGTASFARVKMEVGAVAATEWTPRSLAEEEALCRRYFYRRKKVGSYAVLGMMQTYSGTAAWGGPVALPTPMRAAPTVTMSSPSHFALYNPATGSKTLTALALSGAADALWVGACSFTPAIAAAGTVEMLHFLDAQPGWYSLSAEF